MSYQLLHLTDLHLLGDPQARLHGWRVEQTFTHVLDDALERYPDYDALLLGGDLVDDRSSAGYQRLDRRLVALKRPVLAVAGNHDHPGRMRHHLAHARVHANLTLGNWSVLTLNSHHAGHESGRLGPRQLAALDRDLAVGRTPVLLVVHHPPCPLGSAWIDAIGLEDAPALNNVLARHPRVKAVVCGHAHQAAYRTIAATDCWISPSTMRQFRPASTTFAEDVTQAPGYRWLALQDNGRISTCVHRVNPPVDNPENKTARPLRGQCGATTHGGIS